MTDAIIETLTNVHEDKSICTEMLKELETFDQILPIPHWDAIRHRLMDLVRLYGSAGKYLDDVVQQQESTQTATTETKDEGIEQALSYIRNRLESATASGETGVINIEIDVQMGKPPTLH